MNGVPSTTPSTSVVRQSRPGLAAAPAEPPRPLGGIASDAVRHLYVHLPFCAHRCGYCDFVTVVGRRGQHAVYVDGLLAELELERELLAPELETVFLGGGTPTFTEPGQLERLLAALPRAAEVTVEANPETVTPALAALLRRNGVNRVSLGAQTFQPELLRVLDRVAGPDDVRSAFYHLRDAGFDNISLDLIYGIPWQRPSDLAADIEEALALRPEHLSCYELEAKPGTRFTYVHGEELHRQVEAMEGYFECVVETLVAAGYRWYETANFCRASARSRPFAASAGARRRGSRLTSRRSAKVGGPCASSSRSRTPCSERNASCSGCGSTSRCRSRVSPPPWTRRRSHGWYGSVLRGSYRSASSMRGAR